LFVNYCSTEKLRTCCYFPTDPQSISNHGGQRPMLPYDGQNTSCTVICKSSICPQGLLKQPLGGLDVGSGSLRYSVTKSYFSTTARIGKTRGRRTLQIGNLGDGCVRPTDMDETGIVRTMEEQKRRNHANPISGTVTRYPVGNTEKITVTWYEPEWK
jgi:hypothetical protein